MPKMMCMMSLSDLPLEKQVRVQPMKAFPLIKDLLTDVSWNFRVKKKIKKFKPRPPDAPDGTWRMQQEDIDRVQEFRKCIECFLCQDVCHVLRDHGMHEKFIGPRFLIHVAALEMHPLDTENRVEELRNAYGIGYCNITKCCTEVCPESIHITDNGIIPMKERVVDMRYDPAFLGLRIGRRNDRRPVGPAGGGGTSPIKRPAPLGARTPVREPVSATTTALAPAPPRTPSTADVAVQKATTAASRVDQDVVK